MDNLSLQVNDDNLSLQVNDDNLSLQVKADNLSLQVNMDNLSLQLLRIQGLIYPATDVHNTFKVTNSGSVCKIGLFGTVL